jgi:GNAT superfamily N-acetyltransferase
VTDTAVRAATDEDMPAVRGVAAEFDVLAAWPSPPDFLDLERAAGRLVVAETAGRVVGFAGTLVRSGITHLGDLFVTARCQSSGVGRQLLDAVLPDGSAAVTYASSDPRALGLYVSRGLRPLCPLFYLTGDPTRLPAPATPAGRAGAGEVSDLDAHASGGDRHEQLIWYGRRSGVQAWTVPGGYAFGRLKGGTAVIGPAGGRDPDSATCALLAAAHRIGRHARTATVVVPGVHPALPVLVAAGFRITDMDIVMASAGAAMALDRYVPHPDLG